MRRAAGDHDPDGAPPPLLQHPGRPGRQSEVRPAPSACRGAVVGPGGRGGDGWPGGSTGTSLEWPRGQPSTGAVASWQLPAPCPLGVRGVQYLPRGTALPGDRRGPTRTPRPRGQNDKVCGAHGQVASNCTRVMFLPEACGAEGSGSRARRWRRGQGSSCRRAWAESVRVCVRVRVCARIRVGRVRVCVHPRGPRACACTCAGRRRGRGCSLR